MGVTDDHATGGRGAAIDDLHAKRYICPDFGRSSLCDAHFQDGNGGRRRLSHGWRYRTRLHGIRHAPGSH